MGSGALAHFGYAEESAAAPGTLVTITKFFDPTSADIDDKFPREAIPTMRQDRAQVRSVDKITEVSLEIESPLYYNALPFFFKMALGSVESSQKGTTTAYEHTFSGTKILPSFSAEVDYDESGAKQGAGFKVNTLNIKAQSGEHATCSIKALGLSSYSNAAATVAGLPADDNIATFSHASVAFNSVQTTDVISIDLGIDNGLTSIKTLNGTHFAQRIVEGVRRITCGMDLDFRNQDVYDMSVAATKVAVVLEFLSPVLAGTGYYYKHTITLPNVKFSSVSSPVAADGVISQSVEAIPLYDGSAAYDMQIVTINTDTGYPDVP